VTEKASEAMDYREDEGDGVTRRR